KGFLAGVTGRFRCDSYTDSEGIVRYPVQVIAENVRFLQWPERDTETAAPKNGKASKTEASSKAEASSEAGTLS
ncbi:MAG: single-stranded DNA-binding protein, partial [Clostridiales Family XIII bacterium]|nr:single-stranded DNA-binding protein [Clostridiales Family XIII bacterium]